MSAVLTQHGQENIQEIFGFQLLHPKTTTLGHVKNGLGLLDLGRKMAESHRFRTSSFIVYSMNE